LPRLARQRVKRDFGRWDKTLWVARSAKRPTPTRVLFMRLVAPGLPAGVLGDRGGKSPDCDGGREGLGRANMPALSLPQIWADKVELCDRSTGHACDLLDTKPHGSRCLGTDEMRKASAASCLSVNGLTALTPRDGSRRVWLPLLHRLPNKPRFLATTWRSLGKEQVVLQFGDYTAWSTIAYLESYVTLRARHAVLGDSHALGVTRSLGSTQLAIRAARAVLPWYLVPARVAMRGRERSEPAVPPKSIPGSTLLSSWHRAELGRLCNSG
jgi:hypothetical protein